MVAECLCDSCRAAAKRFERLKGGRNILTEYGATRFGMYRKDRVRFPNGQARLGEFRLTPDAGTRRVVATCCNTPVFTELNGGHWLSLYGHLWQDSEMPPVDFRTITGDLTDAGALPADGVPNLKGHSMKFVVKLLGAWVAMGFKTPRVDVEGKLDG